MRKLRSALLLILTVAILFCAIAPVGFAVSGETGLSFAAANPCYMSVEAAITTLPQTFEATVSFPAETAVTTRGGVIFGSYYAAGITCFNFEIHKNGNPRVYVINDTEDPATGVKTTYDVIFTDVNVYTGNPVHIAVTYDNINGRWYCYIDGELAQTVVADAPAVFDLNTSFCLGGDIRSDNGQYFKGTIHNVAFYSDVRTAQEIVADVTATAATVDTNGLTHYYDLSGITAGELPNTITSPLSKGPKFQKGKPGENSAWWITDKEPVTDYAYSFAIVGDPQILNLNYPEKMSAMYQWIADNKEEKNIQYCLTLGDLTDDNTKAEYDRILADFARLDAVDLPYGFVRGNHDKAANFDTYITYEKCGNKTPESGSFDGTMKNTWQKLTVGSVKYLFINMDYQAKSDMLATISEFISENEDYNVIVSTHVYMNSSAKLTTTLRWEQTDNNELAGIDFWEQLMSRHDNIVMTLCGHAPSAKILRRVTQNVNGYEIPQILIDCQDEDLALGGLGMVAMFYFSEDGSKVQVEHYSVDRDAFYRAESQFEMELNVVNADGSVTPAGPMTPNYNKTYNIRRAGAITNATNSIATLSSEYAAGYRDWMIDAYHGSLSVRQIKDNQLYMGYTAYAKADPRWVAIRLRAPGAGTYEVVVSSDTATPTNPKSGASLNAYLVPASQLPASATAADYAALRTEVNKIGFYAYGTGNLRGSYGTHTLTDSGDYILILEGAGYNSSTQANNFYIKSVELNTVMASIGTQYYTSLLAAFDAAKTGDTVKLEQPYVGELDMPLGVSLDLNGNRCTAAEYVAVTDDDYIIDSKGGGVLDIDSKSLYGNNGSYLPLYNTEKDGYTFHNYTFNVPLADYETVGEATRFWFYVGFEDKAVYDLIAAGDTDVKFGVDLAWGGKSLDVAFADDLPQRWAAEAKNNEKTWLYVDIKGIEKVAGNTLTVTPTIELDGHVYELTNGSMEYKVSMKVEGGFDVHSIS